MLQQQRTYIQRNLFPQTLGVNGDNEIEGSIAANGGDRWFPESRPGATSLKKEKGNATTRVNRQEFWDRQKLGAISHPGVPRTGRLAGAAGAMCRIWCDSTRLDGHGQERPRRHQKRVDYKSYQRRGALSGGFGRRLSRRGRGMWAVQDANRCQGMDGGSQTKQKESKGGRQLGGW